MAIAERTWPMGGTLARLARNKMKNSLHNINNHSSVFMWSKQLATFGHFWPHLAAQFLATIIGDKMDDIKSIIEQYEELEDYMTWGKGDVVTLYYKGDILGHFASMTAAMIFALRHDKKDEETPSILMWKQASIAITAIQEISRAHYNPRSIDKAITKKEAREMLRHIERVLINAKKNAKN